GFAVQASESLGASVYNPIRLPSIAVAGGDALPAGTDAVVPRELAEPNGATHIEVVEAVAAADNVERQGAVATIEAALVAAGTRLAARHIGLLLMAGISRVAVVRRPRVRVLIIKPTKAGGWVDSNGPMIGAAVERDGGVISESVAVERSPTAIAAALVKTGVDIVLVIGGTGRGGDDHAAAARRRGRATRGSRRGAIAGRNDRPRANRRRSTGGAVAGRTGRLPVELRTARRTSNSAAWWPSS